MTDLPPWLQRISIGFPSADAVVTTTGPRVLFDTGYGSDTPRLLDALRAAGVAPEELDLAVNTHWHSDHVGGNAHLRRLGVPVAAAAEDAAAVNAGAGDPCLAHWLDQPVERYRVDRPLRPGEGIAAGPTTWEVLATPGHTPHHLAFFDHDSGVLIAGDAVHADDVGWVNLALDGPAAIDRSLRTLDTLARLPVRVAVTGHGRVIADPPAAIAAARERLEGMRADPAKAARHACRRILAFALMVHDGLPLDGLMERLAGSEWLTAHAREVFGTTPEALAADVVARLERAGAVERAGGRLWCRTPHTRPGAAWLRAAADPRTHWR